MLKYTNGKIFFRFHDKKSYFCDNRCVFSPLSSPANRSSVTFADLAASDETATERKLMKTILLSLLFVVFAVETDDSGDEARVLAMLAERCTQDLWPVDLCGPTLLVNPESRQVLANAADRQGLLSRKGKFYRGQLPDSVRLANTALEWAGVRWSMVLLPLPLDRRKRLGLILHEAFHRIQPQLGFATSGSDNSHLDTRDGRLWFRLEARALAAALATAGAAREVAIEDARQFREQRYALFPPARGAEADLEINEGLAEYTGIGLAYGADAASEAAERLLSGAEGGELIRRFAYLTGPAWGLLLDDRLPTWRTLLSDRPNFVDLMARVMPGPLAQGRLSERAGKYDYVKIARQENNLETKRKVEQEQLRLDLFAAKALLIPLSQMQMQFDPNRVVALPPHGNVYRKIAIQDRWGEIEVDGAAMISTDFQTLRVGEVIHSDAPEFRGKGWVLHVKGGWRLHQDQQGLWRLVKAQGKL